MSSLSILSWIGIAAFCEILYQILAGAFKSAKSLKDIPDIEDIEAIQVGNEKEDEKINFEITPKKKKGFRRRSGRGLTGLDEELDLMYGRKEETTETYIPPEDPLVNDGLRREDKILNGGNVKVSSYYDENGKMVFQRETVLPANDVKNSPKGTNNPSFFIKPQDSASSVRMNNMDDQIFAKELGDSQKSFVDENIKKTFKDIYDMVLPF